MGAGHSHTPAEADTSRLIPRMIAAAGILALFFVVELTTSLLINSIALLADAGHMLTDVVAVFMGLAAVTLARRGSSSPARTYGWHRAEVFTAVANAALLIGVAMFILYEAFERLRETPAVPGVPMIVVALAGLAANFVVALLLRSNASQSLAVKGATWWSRCWSRSGCCRELSPWPARRCEFCPNRRRLTSMWRNCVRRWAPSTASQTCTTFMYGRFRPARTCALHT